MKVSKSILATYNKCTELATKWANILDSYWHKDEKIPRDALADDAKVTIVDNLLSTNGSEVLSANQGRVLKQLINGINQLLTTDDVNLDELQEVVTFIKQNKTDLQNLSIPNIAGLVDALADLELKVGVTEDVSNGYLLVKEKVKNLVYDIELFEVTYDAAADVVLVKLKDVYVPKSEKYIFNEDLLLQNYQNSRNDGQLPTNKILSTDATGNLRMYTIATAPPPYLEELIPDSHLPDATGNFILKGSFFIPQMCDAANLNNTNGILFEGQTINYATFISSNEIHVNLTTGSAEGNFDISLNNGVLSVFEDVLLIVLGTVYRVEQSDVTVTSGNVIVQGGNFEIATKDQLSICEINPSSFEFRTDVDYELRFKYKTSPLEIVPDYNWETIQKIELVDSNGTSKYWIQLSVLRSSDWYFYIHFYTDVNHGDYNHSYPRSKEIFEGMEFKIRNKIYQNGTKEILFFMNNNLMYTAPQAPTENYKIRLTMKEVNYSDFKLIELAV